MHARDRLILARVSLSPLQEVAKDDTFDIKNLFACKGKLLKLFGKLFFEVLSILVVYKPVVEYAHIFVVPEARNYSLFVAILLRSVANALEDLGNVA